MPRKVSKGEAMPHRRQKEQQTERICIRITPTDVKMLDILSETTGLSVTNVTRQAVRREYAAQITLSPKIARPPSASSAPSAPEIRRLPVSFPAAPANRKRSRSSKSSSSV